MTDIIYPSHPDLKAMSKEFVPNKPTVPNPYQVQRLNNPVNPANNPSAPQAYPQPTQIQPAQVQPVQPQAAQPQPVQPQVVPEPVVAAPAVTAPVATAAPAPRAVEAAAEPNGDTNLLQDVSWSSFNAATPPAVQATPQIAPQAAPQITAQPVPNAAPSSAYPPMPSFQMAAAPAAPMMFEKPPVAMAEPVETEQKGLLGSLKQRFGAGRQKDDVKDDTAQKAKVKKIKMPKLKKGAAQTKVAQTKVFETADLAPTMPSQFDAPNLSNAPKVEELSIKKPRSSKLVFLTGLLSGAIFAFLSLAVLDILSPQTEYVASPQASTDANVSDVGTSDTPRESLNDDLIDTLSVASSGDDVFLDEQLGEQN